MYQCFNCGRYAVVWRYDHTFEDMGGTGDGIVHILTCMNCGAEIEYWCRFPEEGEPKDVQDEQTNIFEYL